MTIGVLRILSNYEFDSLDKLSSKIGNLSSADWLNLFNELDEYYSSLPIPQFESTTLTPLTFCFPSLPANELSSISTHLAIADKVLLDDPLYDYIPYLAQNWNPQKSSGESVIKGATSIFAQKATLVDIRNTIAFYLRAKELIQEGKLVVYKQTRLPDFAGQFNTVFMETVLKDKKFRKIYAGNHNIGIIGYEIAKGVISARLQMLFKNKNQDTEFQTHLLANLIEKSPMLSKSLAHGIKIEPLIGSYAIFAICGGLQGLSSDFINTDYAYVFRRAIEVASQLNIQLPSSNQLLLPSSFSTNGIQVPLLHTIPLERVLEVISTEPMAFSAFRASLNERLLQISSPPNTLEREREILLIQQGIEKDLSGISLAYDEIQKSFSRKFAVHLALGASSILVAGLSTISQNLDSLAIASSILAGATLSTSIKEFSKEWLDYHENLLKLKSRENFFVWKILSN